MPKEKLDVSEEDLIEEYDQDEVFDEDDVEEDSTDVDTDKSSDESGDKDDDDEDNTEELKKKFNALNALAASRSSNADVEVPESLKEYFKDGEELTAASMNKALSNFAADMVKVLGRGITEMVNGQLAVSKMSEEFFSLNPDLVPVQGYVGHRMTTLAQEHPDWDYATLFVNLEKSVRKELKMAKNKSQKKKPSNQSRRVRSSKRKGGMPEGKNILQQRLDMIRR